MNVKITTQKARYALPLILSLIFSAFLLVSCNNIFGNVCTYRDDFAIAGVVTHRAIIIALGDGVTIGIGATQFQVVAKPANLSSLPYVNDGRAACRIE